MATAFKSARMSVAVMALAVLAALGGTASARAFSPGQAVITSQGPALITGNLGAFQTTTLPGSPGQGFLMNNGNGTSTLISPGALPQTVATPR